MSLFRIIVCIIVWASVALIWADHHANIIKKGQEPGGIPDYFLRIFAGWVVSFVAYIGISPDQLVNWFGFLVLEAGLFWLIFDLTLNSARGLEPTYVSTTNGKLADKLFHGSFAAQLIAKIIVMTAGAILMCL